MLRPLYLVLFLLAFVGFSLWHAPLGWVMDKAGLRNTGLDWATARGTFLKGDVVGLSFQRSVGPVIAFGGTEMTLKPGALLAGQLKYELNWAAHSGYAKGNLALGLNERATLSDLNSTLKIDQLEGLESALRLSGTTLRLGIDKIVWHLEKGCVKAAGDVSSDWVSVLAQEFGREWSSLSGRLKCSGQNLVIEMRSDSTLGESVRLVISVFPSGVTEAELRLDNLEDSTALIVQGSLENLEPTESGFQYTYRAGR